MQRRGDTSREAYGDLLLGIWRENVVGLELVSMMMSCLQVASVLFSSEVGGLVITVGERGGSRREVLKRPGKFAPVLGPEGAAD